MKRPDLNIVLGTLFGTFVAATVAVGLAGWHWVWFGIAIGVAGGWLISREKKWAIRENYGKTLKSPEGAAQFSPGRKPLVRDENYQSPEEATETGTTETERQ